MSTSNVYAIVRADGAIKIGVSRKPRRRKSQLQCSSPERLRLIHVAKIENLSAFAVERGVKFLLAPCRISGEWFKCHTLTAITAIHAARGGALTDAASVRSQLAEPWRYDSNMMLRPPRGTKADVEEPDVEELATSPSPRRQRTKPWSSRGSKSVLFDDNGNRKVVADCET